MNSTTACVCLALSSLGAVPAQDMPGLQLNATLTTPLVHECEPIGIELALRNDSAARFLGTAFVCWYPDAGRSDGMDAGEPSAPGPQSSWVHLAVDRGAQDVVEVPTRQAQARAMTPGRWRARITVLSSLADASLHLDVPAVTILPSPVNRRIASGEMGADLLLAWVETWHGVTPVTPRQPVHVLGGDLRALGAGRTERMRQLAVAGVSQRMTIQAESLLTRGRLVELSHLADSQEKARELRTVSRRLEVLAKSCPAEGGALGGMKGELTAAWLEALALTGDDGVDALVSLHLAMYPARLERSRLAMAGHATEPRTRKEQTPR